MPLTSKIFRLPAEIIDLTCPDKYAEPAQHHCQSTTAITIREVVHQYRKAVQYIHIRRLYILVYTLQLFLFLFFDLFCPWSSRDPVSRSGQESSIFDIPANLGQLLPQCWKYIVDFSKTAL